MKLTDVISLLKQELNKIDKPANRLNYQRFFKEKLEQPVGIKTAVLRKISNRCFRELRDLPPKEMLKLCDGLLASGEHYARFFAFEWSDKIRDDFTTSDFSLFQRWLKKYVDNWGACDHFCGSTIGPLLLLYPELVKRTELWARSRNRWLRRASAVCLISPVRNRLLLDQVFSRADTLLTDSDDMVQKGYGWMLKEASNVYPKEVFAYVMAHKDQMPRTALRYAIEKYPPAKRKQAMRRD
jgi:3-methyladenine DNA glycosylase AlkD